MSEVITIISTIALILLLIILVMFALGFLVIWLVELYFDLRGK